MAKWNKITWRIHTYIVHAHTLFKFKRIIIQIVHLSEAYFLVPFTQLYKLYIIILSMNSMHSWRIIFLIPVKIFEMGTVKSSYR